MAVHRSRLSHEEGRERHRLETPMSNRFRGRSTINFDFSLKFLYIALSLAQLRRSTLKKEKEKKDEKIKK